MESLDYSLDLQTVRFGYDRKTAWGQARVASMPDQRAVITLQKMRLSGSDVFFQIHAMFSTDGGKTWSDPIPQAGLDRYDAGDDLTGCPCDGTPGWHAKTATLLLTGHTALYEDDRIKPAPRPRQTWYSVLNADTGAFSPMQILEMPDDPRYFSCGAGCTQRVDLPGGDILLPVYYADDRAGTDKPLIMASAVLRCSFDGATLTVRDIGDPLWCDEPRGFCEPSLAKHGERFFLTIRNDVRGYVAASDDGLHFDAPRPWTFDDGSELGNYNTQQHWISHGRGLFLCYTRRTETNDHVFRHRAPLFMAQVDPRRLCVLRDTERVVVPERGARLGNFGTCNVSESESWLLASEWMQTTPPNPTDCTVCERYGANNAVFLARIRWRL